MVSAWPEIFYIPPHIAICVFFFLFPPPLFLCLPLVSNFSWIVILLIWGTFQAHNVQIGTGPLFFPPLYHVVPAIFSSFPAISKGFGENIMSSNRRLVPLSFSISFHSDPWQNKRRWLPLFFPSSPPVQARTPEICSIDDLCSGMSFPLSRCSDVHRLFCLPWATLPLTAAPPPFQPFRIIVGTTSHSWGTHPDPIRLSRSFCLCCTKVPSRHKDRSLPSHETACISARRFPSSWTASCFASDCRPLPAALIIVGFRAPRGQSFFLPPQVSLIICCRLKKSSPTASLCEMGAQITVRSPIRLLVQKSSLTVRLSASCGSPVSSSPLA